MKLSGARVSLEKLLLAHAVDALRYLLWKDTKDGRRNRKRPESFVDILTGKSEAKHKKPDAFDSFEEFERARQRIIAEAKNNG